MGQRDMSANYAAMMDAQTLLKREDFAEVTGQRLSYAAPMDAQMGPSREECARGMGHIAILLTNLQGFKKETSSIPPQVILCQVTITLKSREPFGIERICNGEFKYGIMIG